MKAKNKQNEYVHDGKILLYTHEDNIRIKTKSIMKENGGTLNSKENAKKSIELFHLLTYLDISGNLGKATKIIPNEPDDFLITINGKDILYEIVTVFGDIEAKLITELVKKIFGITDMPDSVINEYPIMDTEKLSEMFRRILYEKQSKQYFLDYKDSVLLLVTSEHDRCGTVPWYLLEDIEENVKNFIHKAQSQIKLMNYFSSGKDGNPTIVNDIEKEMNEYKKLFNEN